MAKAAEQELLLDSNAARLPSAIHHLTVISTLLAVAAALVAAVEALSGRPYETIPSFLTSLPGMTTIAVIFVIAFGCDVLMGRAFRSLLVIAPVALILAFISGEKQQ